MTSTLLSSSFSAHLLTCVPTQVHGDVMAFLHSAGDDGAAIASQDTSEVLSRVLVTIGREEQDCTSLFEPGFEAHALTESQRELIADAEVTYLTTHGLEVNLGVLGAVSDSCIVVANITAYMFARRDYRSSVLSRANILVGNESEWQALLGHLGHDNPEALFSEFPRLQRAYRTLGALGAQAFDATGRFAARAPRTGAKIRTPVGVGDAFASGVLAAHIRDTDLETSLELGMELARLSLASNESCVDPQLAKAFFESW